MKKKKKHLRSFWCNQHLKKRSNFFLCKFITCEIGSCVSHFTRCNIYFTLQSTQLYGHTETCKWSTLLLYMLSDMLARHSIHASTLTHGNTNTLVAYQHNKLVDLQNILSMGRDIQGLHSIQHLQWIYTLAWKGKWMEKRTMILVWIFYAVVGCVIRYFLVFPSYTRE